MLVVALMGMVSVPLSSARLFIFNVISSVICVSRARPSFGSNQIVPLSEPFSIYIPNLSASGVAGLVASRPLKSIAILASRLISAT